MKISRIALILSTILTQSCSTTISGELVSTDKNIPTPPHGKINIVPLNQSQNAKSHLVDLMPDGTFETEDEVTEGEYLIEPLVPGFSSSSIRTHVDASKHLKIKIAPFSKNSKNSIKPQTDISLGRGGGSATLTPPKF